MTLSPVAQRNHAAPTRASATPLMVAVASLQTPIGLLHLFGTERGLLSLALPTEPRSAAEARLSRQVGPVSFQEDEATHQAALAQLTAYFAGTLRAFSVPLDPRGTPFQRQVWDAVAAVHYGATRSYQEIAQSIGRPAAVRAVGAANGANPLPLIIPCHRIIGSNGSLIGYGGGLETKKRLLAFERGGAL